MERQHKKRLTQDQIRLLESSFTFNDKLDPDRKIQLAQELGLPPRKISVWYQNKRARWKAESLEVDYKGLKQKLEDALADNQRLQAEVHRLKHELHKAQEMVSINSCHSISHLSSSCDEVGSSNLDKVDMFACLLGAGQGQFGTTPPNDHHFFPTSIS